MLSKLKFLYGEEKGKSAYEDLQKIISEKKSKIKCEDRESWSEKDIFLITYADSFQEPDIAPLKTLNKFLEAHLKGVIDGVHILPFYPFSSDRGFSVSNFNEVKKEFGTWEEVAKVGSNFRLMADLVLNHISVKHEWFQKFLQGDEKYWNYFIHFEKSEIPEQELKKVFRPRSTPLLTPFKTKKGDRWVWTTFSVEDFTDQVDLNYSNPDILLEMLKTLAFYLTKGVRVFRLDAVAYIWKEIGTNCKHLPQVHKIVSIMHEFLAELCPSAIVITETNVPHEENIAYFGDGRSESQMIYNFSLPSLVLNAFYSGKAEHLTNWAKILSPPSAQCTYFNFLDTHDGIGILGAKGILNQEEINQIFEKIQEHGGELAYRVLPDGSQTVYEMNTTWWSALNSDKIEDYDIRVQKFVTSRAIAFAIKGVPAVYYLSLFGHTNDLDLFAKTKVKRDLNRSNLNLKISDPKIFNAMLELIRRRKTIKAFHPNSSQEVLNLDERVFAFLRGDEKEKLLALHNISKDEVKVEYKNKKYKLTPYSFLWERL